jgi:Holliday junction DNA helicase RuvB
LLRRVRDFAEVSGDGQVTRAAAEYALGRLDVDRLGLDAVDRRILLTIIQRFDGGPVGIDSLAAALAEDRDTLEFVYEPYLIQEGFLLRTPRGRQVTRRAYEHLNLPAPSATRGPPSDAGQGTLF